MCFKANTTHELTTGNIGSYGQSKNCLNGTLKNAVSSCQERQRRPMYPDLTTLEKTLLDSNYAAFN